MRRRESVTHHAPPALQAIEAGPVRTCLEDLYRNVFREAQPSVTQTTVQQVTGTQFVDRGDPAASDYDETDLTADDAWHDLDLSGIVDAGATAVLLRVRLQARTKSLLFRENGNSNAANVAALETGEGGSLQRGDLLVVPDANGVIEYKLSGAVTAVDITVAGWWV